MATLECMMEIHEYLNWNYCPHQVWSLLSVRYMHFEGLKLLVVWVTIVNAFLCWNDLLWKPCWNRSYLNSSLPETDVHQGSEGFYWTLQKVTIGIALGTFSDQQQFCEASLQCSGLYWDGFLDKTATANNMASKWQDLPAYNKTTDISYYNIHMAKFPSFKWS